MKQKTTNYNTDKCFFLVFLSVFPNYNCFISFDLSDESKLIFPSRTRKAKMTWRMKNIAVLTGMRKDTNITRRAYEKFTQNLAE